MAEPNNMQGGEDCIALTNRRAHKHGRKFYSWKDLPCDDAIDHENMSSIDRDDATIHFTY